MFRRKIVQNFKNNSDQKENQIFGKYSDSKYIHIKTVLKNRKK